jgi:hypothetical protein
LAGRHEAHQKADKNDEVEVVAVSCFVYEEEIAEPDAEEGHNKTVTESQNDAYKEHDHDHHVEANAITGPKFYPTKTAVGKVEDGVQVIIGYPLVAEEATHFDEQQEAENDAKGDEKGDVYGREELSPVEVAPGFGRCGNGRHASIVSLNEKMGK